MTEIPDDLAVLFARTSSDGRGWLRRLFETEFRRAGARMPVLLERWLDQLEAEQRAARVSTACPSTFRPSETVSVTEYARTVGTSPQAVRGKCRRGTLPAQMVNNEWRIFIEGPT